MNRIGPENPQGIIFLYNWMFNFWWGPRQQSIARNPKRDELLVALSHQGGQHWAQQALTMWAELFQNLYGHSLDSIFPCLSQGRLVHTLKITRFRWQRNKNRVVSALFRGMECMLEPQVKNSNCETQKWEKIQVIVTLSLQLTLGHWLPTMPLNVPPEPVISRHAPHIPDEFHWLEAIATAPKPAGRGHLVKAQLK
jgi:hypothetical protein